MDPETAKEIIRYSRELMLSTAELLLGMVESRVQRGDYDKPEAILRAAGDLRAAISDATARVDRQDTVRVVRLSGTLVKTCGLSSHIP